MNSGSSIKIFVASSGELKAEREKIILILHDLGKTFPALHLEAVEWETDLPSGSIQKQRFQDEINPLLDPCEVVLVLVYSKIGEYTMEEYRLARAKNKKVFLYFKTGFTTTNKTELIAYHNVLDFREEVEKENQVLFKDYPNLDVLQKELYKDLNLYLAQTYPSQVPMEPAEPVAERLLKGSREYYNKLRGPNGRFKHLHISELILPRSETQWLPTHATVNDPTRTQTAPVSETLASLWQEKIHHAVVLGEGGMGKTVSLVLWWEKLLARQDAPVPIYIALNEFNQIPEAQRHNFIVSYILKNYADEHTTLPHIEKTLTKVPTRSPSHPLTLSPSFIFLLDGFNEITVEKQALLVELKSLRESCPGVQLVLTSRYDMRQTNQWGDWHLVSLCPLTPAQIDGYLPVGTVLQPTLRALLGNPMMLTLYAATCEVQERNAHNHLYRFKPQVESTAELLWNFMEAQVVKLPERLGQDEKEVAYYTFLLRFLLPALGLEMEKAGLFEFTREELSEVLERVCQSFANKDFFVVFPEFLKHRKSLPVGACADSLDSMERAEYLKDIFCQTLCMMVEEGSSYRFLHQNFRDFFAAVEVWNDMLMGLHKKEIPWILKERCLSVFVRQMVGELAGEFRKKPVFIPKKGWHIAQPNSLLGDMVGLCRGLFGEKDREKVGYAVWNLVTIWQELRGELSGLDLSQLDLAGIVLIGIRCSRYYNGDYWAASFAGTRVHEKNLQPQGHSYLVRTAVYSPDGKKILSASADHTIKEWDVATGICVATLYGHSNFVRSAVYSPDGKKILSASYDLTIKEWDVASGICVATLYGHSDYVESAVYSPDGKKILSASDDHIIKEWDVASGICVATLYGHSRDVNSTVYSPDGKKILSASSDCTIKEWDVATGLRVATLAGHSKVVISAVYSIDGKKILSASWDGTIKEWDVASGMCLATLAGHSNYVESAVYSPDGKKILSASDDHTIKEWDVATGLCVATLTGHSSTVTSAVYSANGEKILSSSNDGTIKEWDVASGACLHTHNKDDHPTFPDYPPLDAKNELKTGINTINLPDPNNKEQEKELRNIPGLWIQGCSFLNLEKGSQWTEEGLEILRMYGGKTGS